jgi:hypothetical protein
MVMHANGVDRSEADRLYDETRIIRVISRYFRALDDKQFEESHFRQFLAADARVIRPNGNVTEGLLRIVDSYANSFARFEATQHLLTGHVVDVDARTASLRVNLVAIHLWNDKPADASLQDRSFTAGSVVDASLVRYPDGWRITELENRVIWRTGFRGNMPQTQ